MRKDRDKSAYIDRIIRTLRTDGEGSARQVGRRLGITASHVRAAIANSTKVAEDDRGKLSYVDWERR